MDRKQIEELLDSAALGSLRAVVEEYPNALLTLADAEGRVLWASDNAPRPIDELGPSVVHPDDLDAVTRRFAQAVEGETIQIVYRIQREEGAWERVRSVAWPVSLAGSDRSGFVAVTVPVG